MARLMATMASSAVKLVSVDYEVFGRVQGVFFRKFTQRTATEHGLVGWVQNTLGGTVVGTVQGPEHAVNTMKNWLAKQGSPKSNITDCQFKNEKTVEKVDYSDFNIVKPKGAGTKKKKPAKAVPRR